MSGDDPAPGRSRSYRLRRTEEVGAGVRRVACGRIEKAIEALDREADEDPAGAIHSARKDMKKTRSLLRLVRAELGEKAYRRESRRYGDAGRALSGSRDAEVKVVTLVSLEEHCDGGFPSAEAGGWRRQLEAERDEAAAKGQAAAIHGAIAALEAGREAVPDWPLGEGSWELLSPGLRRGYKRGRKAMARVAADPRDPELVHEWRKRCKDLWYQLRLIRRAWPALLEPTVEEAHELSDLLGDHHDLSLLAEDLAGRADVGSRERLAELIEQRQEQLIEAALALGKRLYAEPPRAFAARLGSYWSAWR